VEKISMQKKYSLPVYRILCIITGCGGGDWPPLLALAAGLKQRGHELMVVCDRSTLISVESSGLKTLCLPQALDLKNIFEPAISRLLSPTGENILRDENPLEIWAISCANYIRISLNDWSPTLVVTSLLGLGLGKILSKDLARPWCFLNPSFCFSSSLLSPREEDFSEMGVQMYRHWLMPLAQKADLVLHATDKAFDFCTEILPSHHRYVGPLFWEKAANALKLLKEEGPPWILITVSTSPQPGDLTVIKTALQALLTMDFRILVTLASNKERDELDWIPANVHLTGYIPHSWVLPYCRLVISHAGHGIVMKAMFHGVPMVLVPWGRDQPGVAARAERLGAAVVVAKSECNVPTLTQAIEKILTDPQYCKRLQTISSRLQKIDGVAEAVDHIERFLSKRMNL
jgi:MGT family glycosyltransferase